MNLIVALCILAASVFALIGTIFEWWDRSRWSFSDVWFITVGSSVSMMFIISQLFGGK